MTQLVNLPRNISFFRNEQIIHAVFSCQLLLNKIIGARCLTLREGFKKKEGQTWAFG